MKNKQDFLEQWKASLKAIAPGVSEETAEEMGIEVWAGRDINVGLNVDDEFLLTMHRYFHGVGSVRLQLLLLSGLGALLPVLLGEQLFNWGYMCGMAHAKGLADVNDIAPAEQAAQCLAQKDGGIAVPFTVQTAEEIEQEDALPPIETSQGILPIGFGGTVPPSEPPDDIDMGGGGYF